MTFAELCDQIRGGPLVNAVVRQWVVDNLTPERLTALIRSVPPEVLGQWLSDQAKALVGG